MIWKKITNGSNFKYNPLLDLFCFFDQIQINRKRDIGKLESTLFLQIFIVKSWMLIPHVMNGYKSQMSV